MNIISRVPAMFGFFALRIFILVIISSQVLAVDRRTPNKAGQQQQPQQWYEKVWKTSGSNSDTVFIDDTRSQRSRLSEGSGAGGDLDDTASGYGEDDEDSKPEGGREIEEGSGARGGGPDYHGGSGDDVGLPPRPVVPPKQTPEPVVEEETSIASLPSTTTLSTTTTTSSAHLLPVTTPTTKPSFIGPVAPPALPSTTARPRHVAETTSTSTVRPTSSSAFYTMRPTTTTTAAVVRHRLITTTSAPTTISVRDKTSPKLIPPMLDETNKANTQNFWMRPGVLAGLIGGAVAGLLAAILLVMFVVYRMRKKDEGSYALEEPKSPPTYTYAYQKAPTREFYA